MGQACCWLRVPRGSLQGPAAHVEEAGAVDVDADELLLRFPRLDALHELRREVHGVPEPAATTRLHVLCRQAGERWVWGVGVLPRLTPGTQPPQLPVRPRSIPRPRRQLQLCHCAMAAAPVSTSEPSQPVAHGGLWVGWLSPMGGHVCAAEPTVGQARDREHHAGMLSQWGFAPWWAPPEGLRSQVPSWGVPAGRQAPLPAKPALSRRRAPLAGAVGGPWPGSPMVGGCAAT